MTLQSDDSRPSSRATSHGEKAEGAPSPPAHSLLHLLKQRRRRRLRKRARILLSLAMYRLLPLLMLLLGVVFCFIGGLYHLHLLFSCGCILLICSMGFILQSCFWRRSRPNKFTINEVIRVTAMGEPCSSQKVSEKDGVTTAEEERGFMKEEKRATKSLHPPSRASVGLLEVRRLNLAMTRIASELRHAAHHCGAGLGPAGLARGLTLGGHPTSIAPMDYERGAINWCDHFTALDLTHMRRLSQWQNFI